MQNLSASQFAASNRNEEFSLPHLLYVRKLVEEAAGFAGGEEFVVCTRTEATPKKPVSEVEPATAYQHFARDVV